MTGRMAVERCRRTAGIVDAALDGSIGPADRAHISTCAACRSEATRVERFEQRLSATSLAAGEGVPDAGVLPNRRRLNLMPFAGLAGAVAAGLIFAAIVGTRGTPDTPPPSAFVSMAGARSELGIIDLVCDGTSGTIECRTMAPDHVHRVSLSEADGRITAAEMAVENLDGKTLDVTGADYLFGRMADAFLAPEAASEVAAWLQADYPSCAATCSADLDNVSLDFARDRTSITLVVRER
jgi:hypothetical protein